MVCVLQDLARKDEERERLEGLFRARLAAANEVAVHWEEVRVLQFSAWVIFVACSSQRLSATSQLEATVVHMLQENGFPPPDVPGMCVCVCVCPCPVCPTGATLLNA